MSHPLNYDDNQNYYYYYFIDSLYRVIQSAYNTLTVNKKSPDDDN